MQLMTIRIPKEMHEDIRQKAFELHISINQLFREITADYLRKIKGN